MLRPRAPRRFATASIVLAIVAAVALPGAAQEPTDPVTELLLGGRNFVAQGIGPKEIILMWTDFASIETGWRIETAPVEAGPWTKAYDRKKCDGSLTVPKTCTFTVPLGVEADPTIRWYRVRAFWRLGSESPIEVCPPPGESPPALEFCGPPTDPDPALAGPKAPTNFAASLVSFDVSLSWTNAAAGDPLFKDNWIFRTPPNPSSPLKFPATPIAKLPASATTFLDTFAGLPPSVRYDTTYGYNVTAVRRVPIPISFEPNHQEESLSASPGVSVTTPKQPPPAAPTDLKAQFVAPDGAALEWMDNATDEDGFLIRWGRTCGFFEEQSAMGPRPGTGTTTWFQSGIVPDTVRCYVVFAYKVTSDTPEETTPPLLSAPSNPAQIVAIPRAPTDLKAAAVSASRVNLTWKDNSAVETGYRVERCAGTACEDFTTLVPDLAPGTTAYADTSTVGDTVYRYRVFAFNASGDSAPSNVAEAKTPSAPYGPPPSNLTATPVDAHHIELNWQDNTTDETNFVIEFQDPGQPFSTLATVPANTTSYLDGFALPGMHTRCYRVRAVKAGVGTSDPSGVACATTPPGAVPTAPSGLMAAAISTTQINLSWTDNSTNEELFVVEHSKDGVAFELLIRLGQNTTTFQHQNLLPNSPHYYRIIAVNFDGQSPPSGIAFALTLGPTRPVWTRPQKSQQVDATNCQMAGTYTLGQGTFDIEIMVYPQIPGAPAQFFDTSKGVQMKPDGTWILFYTFKGNVSYDLQAQAQNADGHSQIAMLHDYTVLGDCLTG